MVHKLYPKIYLLCKVGYTHCKDLAIWPILYVTIIHNLMYYSNKCQLFCKHECLPGGKRGSMVCELLQKPINNNGCDATGDKIEIYVRIMDSVHY